MEDVFNQDEFTQFITTQYITDPDMTDEEKILKVGSSIDEFITALDCFKLRTGEINRH